MQDKASEKKLFRRSCREKRAQISAEQGALSSEALCKLFTATEEYRSAKVILAYYPIGSEADIIPIIKRALSDKKRVALPICKDDSDDMDFYFIESLDSLSEGRFSVPSPSPLSEKYSPTSDARPAVIAVPALAFDKSGKRIGYGRGFYDKYLPRFKGWRVGFQFSELIFDTIPSEAHDAAVHMIVTEKGVIRI